MVNALMCVLVGVLVGVVGVGAEVSYSSTVLSGSYFSFPALDPNNQDSNNLDIFLVTNETNGVLLDGPELLVVANTTIYFNLSAFYLAAGANSAGYYSFPLGLLVDVDFANPLVLHRGQDGAALGLTPTAQSIAAQSCLGAGSTDTGITPHTYGINWTTSTGTTQGVPSTTPCVLQWQVPTPDNYTKPSHRYYYFNPSSPSYPREIHIAAPSSITPSSGPGSGSGSGSGSGNNSTAGSSPTNPIGSSSSSSSSSSSGTAPGSSSSSSSSTGSKNPSAAFPIAHVNIGVWIALVAVLATISAATC